MIDRQIPYEQESPEVPGKPTCACSSKAAIAGCAGDDATIGAPDAIGKALVVASPVEGPPAAGHNHSTAICAHMTLSWFPHCGQDRIQLYLQL